MLAQRLLRLLQVINEGFSLVEEKEGLGSIFRLPGDRWWADAAFDTVDAFDFPHLFDRGRLCFYNLMPLLSG